MRLGKLILPGVIVVMFASFVSEVNFNTSVARTNKPIELVYGPDIYGVACYKDARNTYGDPLSCVKVW